MIAGTIGPVEPRHCEERSDAAISIRLLSLGMEAGLSYREIATPFGLPMTGGSGDSLLNRLGKLSPELTQPIGDND